METTLLYVKCVNVVCVILVKLIGVEYVVLTIVLYLDALS